MGNPAAKCLSWGDLLGSFLRERECGLLARMEVELLENAPLFNLHHCVVAW